MGAGLAAFLPFFKESGCRPIIYTDSKPVVMAYNKMTRGQFSTSQQAATFLHEVLNQGAIVKHISGKHNYTADFYSRNAAPCSDPEKCAICKWADDK